MTTLILKLSAEVIQDIYKLNRFVASKVAFPAVASLTKIVTQSSIASSGGKVINQFAQGTSITNRAKAYAVSALGLGCGIGLAFSTSSPSSTTLSSVTEKVNSTDSHAESQKAVTTFTVRETPKSLNAHSAESDKLQLVKNVPVSINNTIVAQQKITPPVTKVNLEKQVTSILASWMVNTESIRTTYAICEVLSGKYKGAKPASRIASTNTTSNNNALLGLTYGSGTSHSHTQYNGSYQRQMQRARFEAQQASKREMQRYNSHLNSRLRARGGY